MEQHLYESFSTLFGYADDHYRAHLTRLVSEIDRIRRESEDRKKWQVVWDEVESFVRQTRSLSVQDLEELYTRTFDINPVCSLEIGWHLYGETYGRGAFLVKMRDLLRSKGIEESSELPDHLVHVLKLLDRMEGDEREVFAKTYVVPGVKKILDGLAGRSNPYESLVRAVHVALMEHQLRGEPHHG